MKKALLTMIALSCMFQLFAQEVQTDQKVKKLFLGVEYNSEARIVNLSIDNQEDRRILGGFGSLRLQVGYQFDPLNSVSIGSGLARIILISITSQFTFPHHIEYRRFLKNDPKSFFLQFQATYYGQFNPIASGLYDDFREMQFNIGIGKRSMSSKVQFSPYAALGYANQLAIYEGIRSSSRGLSLNIGLRFIIPRSGGLFPQN